MEGLLIDHELMSYPEALKILDKIKYTSTQEKYAITLAIEAIVELMAIKQLVK